MLLSVDVDVDVVVVIVVVFVVDVCNDVVLVLLCCLSNLLEGYVKNKSQNKNRNYLEFGN